ncbi:hypothetical protein [Schaalia sp. Marseille-Q2122]|uniref:hypothetical protein n=1 Tax=Schaalia sp. Marseille-Q2122 TaxID=2736604 RepID=UPI00158EC700|nr:hypothetical protein [Schaalia sp. Marseille-Q2122]
MSRLLSQGNVAALRSWLRVVVAGVVAVVVLAGCGPVGGVVADVGVGESLRVGGEGDRWVRAGELAGEAAGVVGLGSVSAQDVRGFYERFGSVFDSVVFARALGERVGPGVLVDFAVKVGERRGSFETVDGRDVAGEVVAVLGAVALLSAGGVIVGQDQEGLREVSASEIEGRVGQWRALGGARGFDGVEQMFSAAGQRYPMLVAGPEFVLGVVPAALEWDFGRVKAAWEPGWVSARRGGDVVGALLSVMDEPGPVVGDDGWARVDAVQEVLSAQTPFDVDVNEELKWVPRVSFYEEGKAPVGPMPVAQYLVGHRFVEGFKVGADGGEGLGRVLAQAASVGRVPDGVVDGDPAFDVWKDRQKRSTLLAAQTLLGFQEGLEVEAPRVKGQNAFSAANAGLRSWMGEILAPHMGNIAEALDLSLLFPDGENPFFDLIFPGGNWELLLSDEMADRLKGPEGLFVELRFDQPEVDDGGTSEDPSDDVYPRGRIPASERLLLASIKGYHERLLNPDPAQIDDSWMVTIHEWAHVFDALLGDGAPSLEDAVPVSAALNERVAQLLAGNVLNAPLAVGAQRHELDRIQASPWTREAVPTLQAIFPQEEEIADAAEATCRDNRINFLEGGFITALAFDRELLVNNPILLEDLRASTVDAQKNWDAVPFWNADGSIPEATMLTSGQRAWLSTIVFKEAPFDAQHDWMNRALRKVERDRKILDPQ